MQKVQEFDILPGFHVFRNDRKSDNRGRGILLYLCIKKSSQLNLSL